MWPYDRNHSSISQAGAVAALPAPDGDCFGEALNDAEELLKYAAEVGKPVPAEIILKILVAREAIAKGSADQRTRSDFYAAYTVLSAICGDVTARTIRFCSAPATWRALSRNRLLAVVLTLFIAGVSVISFVTDDMSKKIVADVASANADAVLLRTKLIEPRKGDAVPDAFKAQDPCALIDKPDTAGGMILSVDDVTLLQQFAATMRELLGRSLKLNQVIMRMECDPFRMQACSATSRDQSKLSKDELDRRLEIFPAIGNFPAEVLCKIRTYQDVRTFATNVQGDYAAIIGAIASFALPVLYLWLGSFAYRLRLFGDTIRKKTYHPSFADSARMITAVIAGAIVGLFNPTQGIALSPLATAFLVGYGVELFFRFLDTLINFGSPPVNAGQPAVVAPPVIADLRRVANDQP